MDGDDVMTTAAVGRDKIWSVKQIKSETSEFDRERQSFPTVMTGSPQTRFLESVCNVRLCFPTLEDSVLIVLIEGFKCLDHAPHVGANATGAVGGKASVNADMHSGGKYIGAFRNIPVGSCIMESLCSV